MSVWLLSSSPAPLHPSPLALLVVHHLMLWLCLFCLEPVQHSFWGEGFILGMSERINF
ncbi:MAG: hypothetical protein QNJ65_06315 [Xenococcaceae cyanobacterium MO_234.B1]|nr:hypothetical protein [Xenococcaceae cyanobacterium MO_234.B1]